MDILVRRGTAPVGEAFSLEKSTAQESRLESPAFAEDRRRSHKKKI
jgi:hypothetical protein